MSRATGDDQSGSGKQVESFVQGGQCCGEFVQVGPAFSPVSRFGFATFAFD